MNPCIDETVLMNDVKNEMTIPENVILFRNQSVERN